MMAARYRFGAPETVSGGDSSAMRSQRDNGNASLREGLKLTPDLIGLSRRGDQDSVGLESFNESRRRYEDLSEPHLMFRRIVIYPADDLDRCPLGGRVDQLPRLRRSEQHDLLNPPGMQLLKPLLYFPFGNGVQARDLP